MFSLATIQRMNARKDRANARARERRAAAKLVRELAKMKGENPDKAAAPLEAGAFPPEIPGDGTCETCVFSGVHCSPDSPEYGRVDCSSYVRKGD